MGSIRVATPLPVYKQIAELLARQIKAGYWHQGERLPTEADLAKRLNVAIGTLRKALALLAEQGVLERIQGSGTYVRKTDRTRQIYELFRLELTTGPGLPTAEVIDVKRLPRPPEVPLPEASSRAGLWRVRRLRYLSHIPVALEEIWFPASKIKSLSAAELGDSMYLFYQERLQLWIARVEDRIAARPAPTWARQPFQPGPGDATGFIERLSWTAGNELAEYSKTWFDPAICRYCSRMSQ
jgi:DNA-binding GntR family transcriptional regulator